MWLSYDGGIHFVLLRDTTAPSLGMTSCNLHKKAYSINIFAYISNRKAASPANLCALLSTWVRSMPLLCQPRQHYSINNGRENDTLKMSIDSSSSTRRRHRAHIRLDSLEHACEKLSFRAIMSPEFVWTLHASAQHVRKSDMHRMAESHLRKTRRCAGP